MSPAEDGGRHVVHLQAGEDVIAKAGAGQDWTQAARDAFQHIDGILSDNSESLHDAIANIDTFSDALARNSDKVDGILAGLERMTGLRSRCGERGPSAARGGAVLAARGP